jgi:hypothetical protein
LYHTSAKAHYRFRENEQTYQRYLTYVEAIIQDPQAKVYKALKIINILNHLFASKPKKIRHYQRTLAIDYVMKDNQVVLLSYAFSFDYPHVDGVEGLEEEMDKAYTKDVQTLQVDSEFSFVMRNNITLYDQAWKELYLQRNGNLFFGCGKLTHSFPLDRAILEDFKVLKNSDSAYQKLYRIRKTLTETLKMYSHVATPNLMVRLYGIVADQQVLLVKHHFPFYWILED